jgi:Flp pilus assembly pilin Flp
MSLALPAPNKFKGGLMNGIRNQSGQSLLEYMILLALVVLVCVGSTKLLGRKINTKFKEIKEQIDEGIPVRLSP